MKVIDAHCDALFKLQMAKRGKYYDHLLEFRDAPEIETNLKRLQTGGVKVQFFAIFIHPDVPTNEQWQHVLEQVDLFYKEILEKNREMKHIKNFAEIKYLKDNEIGAVLTLEGAEGFGNDLLKLEILIRLGILSVGLTWNHANLCADGIGESRGGGLTTFGKEVVQLINQREILVDVSHLSDQGFWDVVELAEYPFASHSNARTIHNHLRNLPDEAITTLLAKGGHIHVVFNPPFISKKNEETQITDLIRHIEHICSLGGEKQIGFGSDYDGITSFIKGLEHAGLYPNLINELLKYYPEDIVKGFASENIMSFLPGLK